MYTVYGTSSSGNCHKVRLTLEHLGQAYRWVETDIMKGETRTKEFLARNPNGKVPLLEIAPGEYLPESNAIICYLADGSPLWPSARLASAETLQWLFFEQYSHEPFVAVARFIRRYLPPDTPRLADLPKCMDRGYQALGVMEQHLAKRDFFVADRYTVADIALFAYTHVADQGDFDLGRFPAIRAWIARVKAQPGYVEMAPPPR